MQLCPEWQAFPHVPQFLMSLFVSEQPAAQHCSSTLQAGPPSQLAGAWHTPATHASPLAQALPQALQFCLSVCSFTQMGPQHERLPVHVPFVQRGTHLKSVQVSPDGHCEGTSQATHSPGGITQ